jgi:hypothetical protein
LSTAPSLTSEAAASATGDDVRVAADAVELKPPIPESAPAPTTPEPGHPGRTQEFAPVLVVLRAPIDHRGGIAFAKHGRSPSGPAPVPGVSRGLLELLGHTGAIFVASKHSRPRAIRIGPPPVE